ncbi:MAG: DUF305 domain-containing protein [Actinomycetota bacterium]
MRLTRRGLLASSLAAVGVVGVAAVTGCRSAASTGSASSAEPTDVDVGFLADMTTHHGQALVLCQRVVGADTGASVQAAAAEVLQNQSIEVGMMRAWLADWGRSTAPPDTAMAWMGLCGRDDLAGGGMPGLATDEELLALSTADGAAKGRLWLELMRAHHEGGVEMASVASAWASADKVRRLASTQVEVQGYEITMYDRLLATTYASA